MLFQGPTYVGRKKCLHPVREKSRDTLICHSRPWKKLETRRSSTDSRTVWKITLSIRKSSSTYHKRVSRFDWRIRETRRVGALACSRVPRACAHIAKGLNGLLIDLSVQRGNVYQRLRCPRESFSSFYNILQNLFVRMKIDRRFAIEQKGIIIRNQSPPSFFLSFFQWKPGECYSRRHGLRGTLYTRYASANSTKTCRRFFDFRRQGRRVGHKSDFVPACSPSSRIYPRTRCYIDASICCKTTVENIGIMRRLAACQGWSLVFPLDRTVHTLGSWMWKT